MADIDMGTAVLVSLLAQIEDEITEESADYVWCTVAGLRQDPGIQ